MSIFLEIFISSLHAVWFCSLEAKDKDAEKVHRIQFLIFCTVFLQNLKEIYQRVTVCVWKNRQKVRVAQNWKPHIRKTNENVWAALPEYHCTRIWTSDVVEMVKQASVRPFHSFSIWIIEDFYHSVQTFPIRFALLFNGNVLPLLCWTVYRGRDFHSN